MRNWIAIAVVAGAGMGSAFAGTGGPKAAVKDMAFLSGAWRTAVWGGYGDEIWTRPENGNMIALWRFMKDGKLVFTEHISIEEDAQRGPVLRLKHFHPGMKGWEEKDDSLTFHLERFQPGDVQFVHEKDRRRVTLRYRTVADGLECTLVSGTTDKKNETVFRFSRVQ